MDKNLKDAHNNLSAAKDDVKESIADHFDSAKAHVNAHVDQVTDKTKDFMVDAANAVKKAAEAVEEKYSKPDLTTTKK